jgi:beta-glucanase (GH16 family)
MHGPGYSGNTPFAGTNYLTESVANNYHVYAIEWTANGVNWFVDGVKFYGVTKAQVQTYGNWVFDQPMFLLLNVAVGGNWPGNPDGSSIFPQRMYVDYIKVYQ